MMITATKQIPTILKDEKSCIVHIQLKKRMSWSCANELVHQLCVAKRQVERLNEARTSFGLAIKKIVSIFVNGEPIDEDLETLASFLIRGGS